MTHSQEDTFEDHVKIALDECKRGQHLRFIANEYRTLEVCIEAVLRSPKYDLFTGTVNLRDRVIEIVRPKLGVHGTWELDRAIKELESKNKSLNEAKN